MCVCVCVTQQGSDEPDNSSYKGSVVVCLILLQIAACLSEFVQWAHHFLQWFLAELLPWSRPHAHSPAHALFLSHHCMTNTGRDSFIWPSPNRPQSTRSLHVYQQKTIKALKHLKVKCVNCTNKLGHDKAFLSENTSEWIRTEYIIVLCELRRADFLI